MGKRFLKLIIIVAFAFSASGCAVIGAAMGAGAAYGISQAFK